MPRPWDHTWLIFMRQLLAWRACISGQAMEASSAMDGRISPQWGEKLKLLVAERLQEIYPMQSFKSSASLHKAGRLQGSLRMSWKEVGILLSPEMKIQMKQWLLSLNNGQVTGNFALKPSLNWHLKAFVILQRTCLYLTQFDPFR